MLTCISDEGPGYAYKHCCVVTGVEPDSTVSEFVRDSFKGAIVPLLLMLEPANQRVRIGGFQPICKPEWFYEEFGRSHLRLLEARLFHPNGMIHLVADIDPGFRWAAWWEAKDNSLMPDFSASIPARRSGTTQTEMRRVPRTVLLRGHRPPAQFILPSGASTVNRGLTEVTGLSNDHAISAVEYYVGASRRWWRLVIEKR